MESDSTHLENDPEGSEVTPSDWKRDAREKREKIQALVDSLHLRIESTFIPWSKSRNAKENPKPSDYSLNWKVGLLQRDKLIILSTDYSAGIGHCPSYEQKLSVDAFEFVIRECETGHRALPLVGGVARSMGMPIRPDTLDVLHSLVLDADVLNYSSYEEWAPDLGFDPDSRKGEKIYQECMRLALQMRNGLGEDILAQLEEAFQDF